MNGSMSNIDIWDNRESLLSHLAHQLNNCRLSLVLGAGISKALELPSWDELLEEMGYHITEEFGITISPDIKSNEEKADFFRKIYDDQSRYQDYLQLVQHSLYNKSKGVDFEKLNERKVLDAIAALCIPSRRGFVKDIITFNFDNILEIYLRYYGIISHSPLTGNQWRKNADVNIYHIHGFLPKDMPLSHCSKRIIFDSESYQCQTSFSTWEWAPHISSVLRTTTAVFIGLSGHDRNLERFMKDSNAKHAYRDYSYDSFWGVSFIRKKDNMAGTIKLWKKWGIYPIIISGNDDKKGCTHDEFEDGIKSFLFSISQKAAELL